MTARGAAKFRRPEPSAVGSVGYRRRHWQAGREVVVAVTGLANLAVKVADLDAACSFYAAAGAEVRDRGPWENGERADVLLGPVLITLFTRAIYEDDVVLPAEGFLHPALFTDDLDAELEGHDVVWGPAVVSGVFGTRRIAFVAAPGGIRLEFMEQLAPPPRPPVPKADPPPPDPPPPDPPNADPPKAGSR
ncbi:MAG TPA: VOC family protein [Acidimicrobiales bacterium]